MITSLAEKYIKSNELLIRIKKNIHNYENFKNLVYYWNKKINLTSYEENDFYFHAIIENFLIFERIPLPENLLDIGTGFGNPSISLAITFPELEIFCSEVNKKRLSFLYYVKNYFELNNLKILETSYPEKKFDIITARAFMEIKNLFSFLKNKNLKYNKLWLFLKKFHKFENIENFISYKYKNKEYFQVLVFNYLL